ncbi:MAG: metallophosphoesterase [Thermoplasmata archaeon]|nr:metallophosphoesterase [Thermoplasmata archaeon]
MDPRNFRFAHLADAHVGAWSRDAAVRHALRASVLGALAEVETRDCEFLLISGDLFHTPIPEPSEVAPVAAALKRLTDAGRRVYVIYGSHDYVAHRVSWLDVLAETGIFLRAAPEAVRVEGERWTLPFHTDGPTGAQIAGISGRAHGLDRSYFAAVDSEAFRAAPGFKIFQFHAAIEEYLPEPFRGHIHGVPVHDLPGGCDYYAGGHIHYSYSGEGPDGGLLVNPGAVFGTSVKDLEYGAAGRSHQGVVVVTVRDGRPEVEFVDTAPRARLKVFDVDLTGRSAEEARATVAKAIETQASPGALLFPRLHGRISDGSLAGLGLRASDAEASALGAAAVHWDVQEVAVEREADGAPLATGDVVDREVFAELARNQDPALPELAGPDGESKMGELVRQLGFARADGQSLADYRVERIEVALEILGVTRAHRPRAEPRARAT